MANKRLIWFAVLLVAILAVMLWMAGTPAPEPSYGGKNVDAWLEFLDMKRDPLCSSEAATNFAPWSEALCKIGPVAIPFIFRKVDQNDSPRVNNYRAAWPKFPKVSQELLPAPKPVDFSVSVAVEALLIYCTNRETIQLLINGLGDGNPTDPLVRLCALRMLGGPEYVRMDIVPQLIPLLQSSETGRSDPAWPFSMSHVYVRSTAALALDKIGPAASNAIPALTNMIATGEAYQRVAAAVAIWHITSQTNIALPVLLRERPLLPEGQRGIALKALKEIGARFYGPAQ